MPTAIHKKIRACEKGELITAICKLKSGWVVAGDVQPLQGYCILMADPVTKDFNDLSELARGQYAMDMGRIGDALIKVRGAHRINYETWGNQDPALHTHIVPDSPASPRSCGCKLRDKPTIGIQAAPLAPTSMESGSTSYANI